MRGIVRTNLNISPYCDILLYMDYWKNISHLSKDEIISLQTRKLHQFINQQLYPFSPHYRQLFNKHKIKPSHIKTISDLKIIPFTTKKDLLPIRANPEKYREFVLQPNEKLIKKYWPIFKKTSLGIMRLSKGKDYIREKLMREYLPIFLTATTGRTTRPIPFLYTNYDIKNLYVSGARILQLIGTKKEDRGVNMFPFAPHLAFWQVAFSGLSYNAFILSTGGGKVMGTEGNIRAIENIKPAYIVGVPGFVYHVTRTAAEHSCDFGSTRCVILGASRVPVGYKKKLAVLLTQLGAKNFSIIGTYGFTEARCAWAECPTSIDTSSGYHLYPDKEIFEVINPRTQEPVGEGEDGELVYTNLDARGSCVLRYRTGDLVKGGITYKPCPHCGLTVPRVSSDITRVSNIKSLRLTKIKGSLVNLNALSQILDDNPQILEWQLEIRKKDNDPYEVDELILYLALGKDTVPQKIKNELKRKILVECEVSPNEIRTLPLDEIVKRLDMETGQKEKRIIDKRPQA